jgi:transcriptional regulator with XRE-family HTH domain
MPDRNIPVKNEYASQALASQGGRWHNMPMERVRQIREAKGWTQADLAEASGINQGFISKVENGTANPTLDKIEIIARALGVQPYELFSPDGLKARALMAIGQMPDAKAEAAVVVLEAMVSDPNGK